MKVLLSKSPPTPPLPFFPICFENVGEVAGKLQKFSLDTVVRVQAVVEITLKFCNFTVVVLRNFEVLLLRETVVFCEILNHRLPRPSHPFYLTSSVSALPVQGLLPISIDLPPSSAKKLTTTNRNGSGNLNTSNMSTSNTSSNNNSLTGFGQSTTLVRGGFQQPQGNFAISGGAVSVHPPGRPLPRGVFGSSAHSTVLDLTGDDSSIGRGSVFRGAAANLPRTPPAPSNIRNPFGGEVSAFPSSPAVRGLTGNFYHGGSSAGNNAGRRVSIDNIGAQDMLTRRAEAGSRSRAARALRQVDRGVYFVGSTLRLTALNEAFRELEVRSPT